MEDGSENIQAQQIKQFTSTLKDGMLTLGKDLENSDQKLGAGQTEQLPEPITDSFGTFKNKKDFFVGCDIGKTLDEKGGVVVFSSEDGSTKKVAEIGRTPIGYNPSSGGILIENAGAYEEYLLAIRSRNLQTHEEKMTYRYVNKNELSGTELKKGAPATFKPSTNAGRQIIIQGTVTQVAAVF